MSKKKKLVIKVNYDNRDKRSTDDPLSMELTKESSNKNIVIVLLLLFAILAGLYYAFIKLSPPIIDIPSFSSITNWLYKKENSQMTDTQENRQKVISEQSGLEKVEVDKDVKKGVATIAKKSKDNISAIKPILSSKVVRSQLTNRVINNEPRDLMSSPVLIKRDNIRMIYYFTELKNMSGETIYHDWIYKGKSVFKKRFDIKGNRWRLTTQKNLNNTSFGKWKVKLTDIKGNSLHEINFKVTKQ
jgi:hypothetical protein